MLIAHPSWGECWNMGSSPDSPPCESLATRDYHLAVGEVELIRVTQSCIYVVGHTYSELIIVK